jgi:hypothetical protein
MSNIIFAFVDSPINSSSILTPKKQKNAHRKTNMVSIALPLNEDRLMSSPDSCFHKKEDPASGGVNTSRLKRKIIPEFDNELAIIAKYSSRIDEKQANIEKRSSVSEFSRPSCDIFKSIIIST